MHSVNSDGNPRDRQLHSGFGTHGHTSETVSDQPAAAAIRFGLAEVESEDAVSTPVWRIADRRITGFAPPPVRRENIAHDAFANLDTRTYLFGKRLFDLLFASAAIVVTSPLLLLIGIAIKLSSPGPVFFRQERIGKNGRIFDMLKFRTMRVADRSFTDKSWRALDDPRRTVVGSILRRTSLDELPQFFNVLIGEMSVVGPRPERPFFVNKFISEIPGYALRHRGQVGITGLAQIHGFRGDTCIQTRVIYDIEYLEKWSFALDLHIVWLTVKGIFTSDHESQPKQVCD